MKIIFLDIDGVLVTRRHLSSLMQSGQRFSDGMGLSLFDPICVENFIRIINETNAQIVISSTWRMMPDAVDIVWAERKMPGRIVSVTPRSSSGRRGEEIQRWFEVHKDNFDVERFVIIDDEVADMGEMLPHVVKTTWMSGLTQELADEIINRLNN